MYLVLEIAAVSLNSLTIISRSYREVRAQVYAACQDKKSHLPLPHSHL